ncbi:MAG TPA: DUF1330 domain-containing protein [Anaeromyxobacteraceae bacterium]|nr:DUF1330 domain-containing protein [Anaeromyxobacteraceae bacterium]
MAAYLVGRMTVKNPELWREYVAGVGRSLAPFDAQILFRGEAGSPLAGELPHDRAVVIRFIDEDAVLAWFHSADYQALVPLRNRAADVDLAWYRDAT